MAQTIHPQFRAHVDGILDGMLARFYEQAPAARYLAHAAGIDVELFKRHTTETILRIRLARVADGKAIHLLAKTDPRAAQKWARYAEEEMLHDRLFLKDLENLGVAEESVYATDPLLATKLLQGYLYYTLEHEGPQALVTKSYFVEYTTRKTQRQWNDNIERSLGERAVKGAEAHLDYDIDEDHSTDVWNVLMTLVHGQGDEQRVVYHLHAYFGLFCAYFDELASRANADLAPGFRDPSSSVIQGAGRAG
jgi:hypothetical protein